MNEWWLPPPSSSARSRERRRRAAATRSGAKASVWRRRGRTRTEAREASSRHHGQAQAPERATQEGERHDPAAEPGPLRLAPPRGRTLAGAVCVNHVERRAQPRRICVPPLAAPPSVGFQHCSRLGSVIAERNSASTGVPGHQGQVWRHPTRHLGAPHKFPPQSPEAHAPLLALLGLIYRACRTTVAFKTRQRSRSGRAEAPAVPAAMHPGGTAQPWRAQIK